MVKIATCRQTGLGTGWCDALRVALVMVTFVVFVLLAGGCGRPWRYRGSKIQRTLAKVQDDEVIELTYIWKHLLSRPPSEFRDDTRYARFRGSDRQGLVHWPDRTDDDDPTYHVCVDVTRPPAVGQMTELHRRLVEAGFAPIGAPGAPWRRTWTYRAPAGVREKAAELLPEALAALRQRLRNELPEMNVSEGMRARLELTRQVGIWPMPIAPGSVDRLLVARRSRRLNYVFPTLGQVVVIEAILLRPGEWDTIRQAAAEELAPLIGLDSRHHVWSGVTTRGRRPTGENQLTD